MQNIPAYTSEEKYVNNCLKSMNEFIKNNQNVLTRAGKGNATVLLDKNEYLNKMEQMLADKDIYKVISKDPSKKLTNDLYNLISRWKKNNYIDELIKRLRITDGIILRAYGLKFANPTHL